MPRRALGRRRGEREREARPRGLAVGEDELAAHALGQLAADRQAEAEAALRAGGAAAVEALEDVLALLGRDARPVVGHLDADVAALPRGAQRHGLAGRAVAQRVVEQDPDD